MNLYDDGHFYSSDAHSHVQSMGHDPFRETGAPALLNGGQHLIYSSLKQETLKLTYMTQKRMKGPRAKKDEEFTRINLTLYMRSGLCTCYVQNG